MKAALVGLILLIFCTGCPGTATADIGMTDDQVLGRAPLGSIYLRALKIELPENGEYQTVWTGPQTVAVTIGSSSMASITLNPVDIQAADYDRIRVTVDSVGFSDGTNQTLLSAAETQFVAQAIAAIPVDDGDAVTMVINIASPNWFDLDSIRIKPGAAIFEGATLKRGL